MTANFAARAGSGVISIASEATWPRRDRSNWHVGRGAPAAVPGLLVLAPDRCQTMRACTLATLVAAAVLTLSAAAAQAAPTVGLGTAATFGILAGQGVTNTGSSVISGNVGTSPAAAVTGFPPGLVHGQIHRSDAVALQAQSDLTTAYNDAAGRTGAALLPQLGGQTLTPGVYNGGALNLTGTLTLNGHGVYIFTASSSLITATGSTVSLINGADPCDVFWQVTSSATLDGPGFAGTVMALTSITVGSGVHVDGRLLARNGSVSLINDVVDSAACGGNTSGGSSGASATIRSSASFIGPCGDPMYAARFNNRRSNRAVTFRLVYISFATGEAVSVTKKVQGGHSYTTPLFHVKASTVMIIRGWHNRILRRIRAAPAGNYEPC